MSENKQSLPQRLGQPISPGAMKQHHLYLLAITKIHEINPSHLLMAEPVYVNEQQQDVLAVAHSQGVGLATYDELRAQYQGRIDIYNPPSDCDSLNYLNDRRVKPMIIVNKSGSINALAFGKALRSVADDYDKLLRSTLFDDRGKLIECCGDGFSVILLGTPVEYGSCAEAERDLGMTLTWTSNASRHLGYKNKVLMATVENKDR